MNPGPKASGSDNGAGDRSSLYQKSSPIAGSKHVDLFLFVPEIPTPAPSILSSDLTGDPGTCDPRVIFQGRRHGERRYPRASVTVVRKGRNRGRDRGPMDIDRDRPASSGKGVRGSQGRRLTSTPRVEGGLIHKTIAIRIRRPLQRGSVQPRRRPVVDRPRLARGHAPRAPSATGALRARAPPPAGPCARRRPRRRGKFLLIRSPCCETAARKRAPLPRLFSCMPVSNRTLLKAQRVRCAPCRMSQHRQTMGTAPGPGQHAEEGHAPRW